MAAPTNPSFETQGALPGEAASWTEGYSDSAEDIAEFGAGPRNRPYEGFIGGWSSNHQWHPGFYSSDLTAAMFELLSLAYENFENSWGAPAPFNNQSAFTFDASNFTASLFDGASEDEEDFEDNWDSNETSEAGFPVFGSGTISAASFDSGTPEAIEDFEEEWLDNEDSEAGFPSFGSGTLNAASFTGAVAYENFEGAWTATLP